MKSSTYITSLRVIIAIFTGLIVAACSNDKLEDGPFVLKTKPVSLHTDDNTIRSIGKLDYIAGWVLNADHSNFGGLSGLTVKQNQSAKDLFHVTSITDAGFWFTFDFSIADKTFKSEKLTPYNPLWADASLNDDKTKRDAEAILMQDTGYLVSFEQEHRIEEVTTLGIPGEPSVRFNPDIFSDLPNNGGIEAMTLMHDGNLLAFAEGGRKADGRMDAWLIKDGAGEHLWLKPPSNFAPTDAKTLPNGDVLIIFRHYSILRGSVITLARIDGQSIKAGSEAKWQEIATFSPPYVVDNMEGLGTVTTNDGRTLVFLVSDDNFNPLQQTYFLVFELKA